MCKLNTTPIRSLSVNQLWSPLVFLLIMLPEGRVYSRRFVRPYVCPSFRPRLVLGITLKLQEVLIQNIVRR